MRVRKEKEKINGVTQDIKSSTKKTTNLLTQSTPFVIVVKLERASILALFINSKLFVGYQKLSSKAQTI